MDSKQTGILGERIAAEYLSEKGYSIIAMNVHVGHCELDIIASNGIYLVFAEVKTRHAVYGKRSVYGTPADAVDRKKRENLVKAAEAYYRGNDKYSGLFPRIDVIEVYLDGNDNPSAVEHYENAVRKRDLHRDCHNRRG